MSNLTTVTLTAGVPTAGTGTVSTIDNMLGTAGTANTNVLSVQGIASGVAQPVSGTVAATQSGTWNVTNVSGTVSLPTGAATSANQTNKTAFTQLTDGTNAATTYTSYGTAPSGNVPGVNAFITNANANGQTTMSGSAPVTIASNQSALATTAATATTGGSSTSLLIAANSTNATSLKASAGTLYGCQVFNNGATIGYLKFYNKASSPTVGTDTPVKVIMIPASSGAVVDLPPMGVAFGTGIAYAVTAGIANTDTTAVAASEYIINIDYA